MSKSKPQEKKEYNPFQLLEPMTETPLEVIQFARPFIAKSKWIFAKTMPESPHEYVLRRNCFMAGFEDEFIQMVELIRQHGYKGRYHKTRLTYMNVDDHRYWSMGAPIRRYPDGPPVFDGRGRPEWPASETILINRARNDDLPSICCSLAVATSGKHHARTCRNYEASEEAVS